MVHHVEEVVEDGPPVPRRPRILAFLAGYGVGIMEVVVVGFVLWALAGWSAWAALAGALVPLTPIAIAQGLALAQVAEDRELRRYHLSHLPRGVAARRVANDDTLVPL